MLIGCERGYERECVMREGVLTGCEIVWSDHELFGDLQ